MSNPRGQPAPQNTPTGQFEIGSDSNREVQAIHNLRSGRRVDNQVGDPPNNPNFVKKKEKEDPKDSAKKDNQVVVDNQEKSFVPKTPFPQRLQPTRKKNHYERILKVFKNVQINILFLDAINQIPSYAKFLMDLITVKRKVLYLVKLHLLQKHYVSSSNPLHPSMRIRGLQLFLLG